jgi:hypothetical protein
MPKSYFNVILYPKGYIYGKTKIYLIGYNLELQKANLQ